MNNNLNTPNSVFLIEANLNEIIEAMMFMDLSDFEKAFASGFLIAPSHDLSRFRISL